jgi:cytochrome b6-f complex iron-sulfur subunit
MAEPSDHGGDRGPAGAAGAAGGADGERGERGDRDNHGDHGDHGDRRGVSRRDLLVSVGVGACVAATAGAGLVTVDFLDPKVLFEPPTRFKAGLPGDYPEGTVRFDREHRAYVIGTPGGVYALSAVCTHLGCITRYHADERAIACPCHGSRYDLEGNVTQGPAPRALTWIEVAVDPAGTLVVDTAVPVEHGRIFRT